MLMNTFQMNKNFTKCLEVSQKLLTFAEKLRIMRKIVILLSVLAAVCGCTSGNREYSDVRKAPWLYPTGDGKFTTFERYMWDGGFPDTIIVRFTRDGEFEGYVEAVRQGVLEDSLGNYCSPTYVFTSMVGDSWTYDINGRFLEFSCADRPHSGHPHTYHP